MPSVTHHDRTTAYAHTDRDGPTLLCVHGSGGTRAVWKAQRARLDTGVVALDLGDHGESTAIDATPGNGRLEAYVDDVVAVADRTAPDVLVGHSLGGAVVLQTLLDGDVPVDAAIVLGAGPRLPVADHVQTWVATDFERFLSFMHDPDRLFHTPDNRLLTQSKQMLTDVGQSVTRADFAVCDRFDIRARLDEIDIPVLGIVGVHDTLTPPRLVTSLTDGVPTGSLAEIDDAAHMAMVEQPRRVNAEITSFLEATITE